MKKINKEGNSRLDEILPEYDFRGRVRGKHHEAYRKGHTVRVRKPDETVVETHFTPKKGSPGKRHAD